MNMGLVTLGRGKHSPAIVTEKSRFQVKTAAEKIMSYRTRSHNKMLAKLIQAGCETLRPETYELIYFMFNKDEMSQQSKESINKSTYNNVNETDCSNDRGILLFLAAQKRLSSNISLKGNPYVGEILEKISVDFHITDQLLNIFLLLHSSDTEEKMGA
jgi:hypothetical protein